MHARNLLFCEGAILLLGSLATSVKQGTSINMKVNFLFPEITGSVIFPLRVHKSFPELLLFCFLWGRKIKKILS